MCNHVVFILYMLVCSGRLTENYDRHGWITWSACRRKAHAELYQSVSLILISSCSLDDCCVCASRFIRRGGWQGAVQTGGECLGSQQSSYRETNRPVSGCGSVSTWSVVGFVPVNVCLEWATWWQFLSEQWGAVLQEDTCSAHSFFFLLCSLSIFLLPFFGSPSLPQVCGYICTSFGLQQFSSAAQSTHERCSCLQRHHTGTAPPTLARSPTARYILFPQYFTLCSGTWNAF